MATASPASAPSAHPLAAEPEFAVVNGDFLPLAEARISVLDLGFLRGLGVFETLRTYGGLPHALARHLDRLHASALATLDLRMEQLNLDQLTLRRHIARAHTLCRSELRINLLVTPGELRRGVFGADAPTTVLLLRPLHEPPRSWYEDGVGVTTFAGGRICPEFKTTAYITGRKGLLAAEAAGAQEALYVDERGEIAEGVTSNVLALRGRELLSPRVANLPGITRDGLVRLAAARGVVLRESPLTRSDLLAADEVWICSAIRELLPVVRVDGEPVGGGRPGRLARELGPAYRALCEAEARSADAEAGSAGTA